MKSLTARTIRQAVAATTLVTAAAFATAAGSAAMSSPATASAAAGNSASSAIAGHNSDYHDAYTLGLEAYTYGEPLMDMQSVFKTETSVTVPDHQGDAPVNQWSHATALADTKE